MIAKAQRTALVSAMWIVVRHADQHRLQPTAASEVLSFAAAEAVHCADKMTEAMA